MSTNRFRKTYPTLTGEEKHRLDRLKSSAERLAEIYDECEPSRETSLAMTKLEESVMWAVKGITG